MIEVFDKNLTTTNFPDGTISMKAPYVGERTDVIIYWFYEGDEELFKLICLSKYYRKNDVYLFMPYVPNARMDRTKHTEEIFTLKYFCEVINSLGFKEVAILDPHSDVAPALLNNVTVLSSEGYVNKCIEDLKDENLVLFFPDSGSYKRYSGNFPGHEFTYGVKVRNWETGKIENFQVMNPEIVKDRNVLIIDDICSYGGTFVAAAKALKDAGAKNIHLFVTHCETNIFKGKVFDYFTSVTTTNSIMPLKEANEKLKIIELT